MKLYGSIISPYVARVVYAARLKGLDLEAQMPANGIKSPDYLQINPLGKMPALDLGSQAIAESMVIMDYLEDAYPQKPLLPADPAERARARLLGRIVDLYVMPQGNAFFGSLDPQKRNADAVQAAVAAYRKSLAQLEHFMAPSAYADCALLPCLQMMVIVTGLCGIEENFDDYPKIAQWWASMQANPTTKAWINEYDAGFRGFLKSRH
ncbi:MAG: glutathione S-transferase family protein [Steroidobacteraceae bacterium]